MYIINVMNAKHLPCPVSSCYILSWQILWPPWCQCRYSGGSGTWQSWVQCSLFPSSWCPCRGERRTICSVSGPARRSPRWAAWACPCWRGRWVHRGQYLGLEDWAENELQMLYEVHIDYICTICSKTIRYSIEADLHEGIFLDAQHVRIRLPCPFTSVTICCLCSNCGKIFWTQLSAIMHHVC